MAIVHLPGCKICLIAFCLFSALECDYIQWHKFNRSGTAPANKATKRIFHAQLTQLSVRSIREGQGRVVL